MLKCLATLLVLLCLLAGCSSTGTGADVANTDQSPYASEDLNSLFEDQTATREVGSVSFGFADECNTFTYTGEPLKIPFHITGMAEDITTEIGLMLFVDGISQPWSAVYTKGTDLTLPDSYMQTFRLQNEETAEFNIVFQPVTGQVGDTLSIQPVSILSPSFLPKSTENPSYGVYHAASATIPLHINFQADTESEVSLVSSKDYPIVSIPKETIDNLKFFGALDSLDTCSRLEIVPDSEDSRIVQSDGKTASVKVRLYGGPEANFHITLFVNHRPVQINGADNLAVKTEKNKMVEATLTFDVSALDERNTVYAIAAPAGGDNGIVGTLKSDSILLLK